MKININIDSQKEETEVSINCHKLTPDIERMISLLRIIDQQLIGKKDDEIHILDTDQVLFAESVDKRLFLYSSNGIYETNLKLYELEEQLENVGFLRINKATIVNLAHVKSLKADLNRKIKLQLDNGEYLVVSRQYAAVFKERLGI